MMPIVWFYIALVLVLWGLLAYVELQHRKRQRVRGCLELDAISADQLWSRMIMDPLLTVIELQGGQMDRPVLIQGAKRVSISHLETYLRSAPAGRSFAFYSTSPGGVPWIDVDRSVCGAGRKRGLVLEGDIELWRKSRLPLNTAHPNLAAG
jgi:hypothetical protein